MLLLAMAMKSSDFEYDLPPEYIAQTPIEPRDASRLLILDRASGQINHTVFCEIAGCLHPGDLLVMNQTRVIPARLYARKLTGGRVEILLLHREDEHTWECLVGGTGLSLGKKVRVEGGPDAEVVGVHNGSRRLVRFDEPIEFHLPRAGHVPLPPYIHTPLSDPERYQTVYARDVGSSAAPTAGLHFTPSLLEELRSHGIALTYITLHIGLDTFAPVTVDDPNQHRIHTEWCQVTEQAAATINAVKSAGGRIIAVGTTSVRGLESSAQNSVCIPYLGPTSLYILPGYQFKIVDALITNFHLPRSTLLMLVSAFAGLELILESYEVAKKEGYRFYSFGDAMFIL